MARFDNLIIISFMQAFLFSELRQSLRDTMNINMQKFADQWSTKRGIRVRTRMVNFEGEVFVRDGTDVHLDRNSQVRRLRDIRKLYKIIINSFYI